MNLSVWHVCAYECNLCASGKCVCVPNCSLSTGALVCSLHNERNTMMFYYRILEFGFFCFVLRMFHKCVNASI